MTLEKTNKLPYHPGYYYREFANDISEPLPEKLNSSSWIDQSKRVAFAALPFISLYKPLSFSLSFAMGCLRTFTSFTQLVEHIKEREVKPIVIGCLNTTVAIIALAGTLFAHPLGMLISTGHDLMIAVIQLAQNLHKGDYKKAAECCLNIVNNALYLALFLHGGLEISIGSLTMQLLIGIYYSQAEFRNGYYIEGISHLLMSIVRGNQLINQVQALQLQNKFQDMKNYLKTLVLSTDDVRIDDGQFGRFHHAYYEYDEGVKYHVVTCLNDGPFKGYQYITGFVEMETWSVEWHDDHFINYYDDRRIISYNNKQIIEIN